ncbi:uncharacterized protein JCM15063_003610 [Sporobolomyces koalae]|uniref:uncharacterized protein n=1 Tax=Sporobolomyces koalae TaxID=500713 RepID=UPI00317C598B
MAEAPPKKVFSIFQPKTRPVPRPDEATESSPSSLNPADNTSQDRLEASQDPSTSQGSSSTRPATPMLSQEGAGIVLGSSDDDAPAGTGSMSEQPRKRARGQKPVKTSSKRKGLPRTVVLDSDDDDNDVIVVTGGSPRKPKKGKKSTTGGNDSRKAKKALKPTESIDLTNSPVRPSTRFIPSISSSSSSFAPLSQVYRQDRERRKAREGIEPRWPTAEEHGFFVPDPVAAELGAKHRPRYPARLLANDKGKEKQVDRDQEEEEGFFQRFARSVQNESSASGPHEAHSLPRASTSKALPTYPSHPLLDRIAASIRDKLEHAADRTVESEMWTSKYGPKKAEEILGQVSRTSAMLLKEWMTELKVAEGIADQHAKKRRRPINRGIDKKKKKRRRDGLDDFVAGSSEDEEDGILLDSSAFDLLDDDIPLMTATGHASSSSSAFRRLTNLILLSGPSGSGKTVAVYAVAQELGYEIFEVNAGMGKRRAKDLESEVGDVGRNHIVRASPKKPNVKDFFAGFKPNISKAGASATMNEGIGEAKLGGPAQSLILVEEADVLFSGEEDFWTGIRALAAESRRPIILTCTDSNLIPIDQLGLQKIHLVGADPREPLQGLEFASPETSIAVPYLRLVARAEGHILSEQSLQELYDERTLSTPNPAWLCRNARERPLPHPFSSAAPASKDLRRAIMQLQFELQRETVSRTSGTDGDGQDTGSEFFQSEQSVVDNIEDDPDWLERAVKASDSLSFADAQVARRIETRIEDLDTGPFTTLSDHQLGYPILEPQPSHLVRLPFMGREPEMTSMINRLAYTIYPRAVRFSDQVDENLEAKKLEYLNRLAMLSTQFFYDPEEDLYHPGAPILPNPSLVIDYLPLYRHLTSIDDERERIANVPGENGMVNGVAEGGGRGAGVRRSTRVAGGQGKIKIKREIEWRTLEDVEWVRKSGF